MKQFDIIHLCTLVLLLLLPEKCTSSLKPLQQRPRQQQQHTIIRKQFSCQSSLLALHRRGGDSAADDDEVDGEKTDEGDDDDDDDDSVEVSQATGSMILDVLRLVGKTALATTKAFTRALQAAFETEEMDEESTIFSKVLDTVQRMWRAALTTATTKMSSSKQKDEDDDDDDDDDSLESGSFLSKKYGVEDARGDDAKPILSGSIGDALVEARSQARLLVAFIPSSLSSSSANQIAITSLLSPQVSAVAERKSRKSSSSSTTSASNGSFRFWSAPPKSPEAMAAMKRLKAKHPKGDTKLERPILVVAYPAQVLSPSGTAKLVPKLLAQHHCSPPPSSETMAAWLNALRKRHSKQYAVMQRDLKEAQLYRERQEGYLSSIQEDVERLKRQEEVAAVQKAEEEAEANRLAALERRRDELKESLPDEPPSGNASAVMTIALRFADGRAGQRRFEDSTPVMTVLNWADAMYGAEREKIVLSTMNGQKTFEWKEDDTTTLKEAGLGRMTGLRVLEKKEEEAESSTKDDDNDSNTGESDDDE